MSLLLRAVPVVFVLLWSTGFIGSRMGAPYAEPMTFLVLRYVAVLAILAVSMIIVRPRRGMTMRERGHAVVVGVLIHGIYLGGVFWSIDNGMPAGVAALIVGLQPLVTALFAGMILGERIDARYWIGMAVGLVGVGLVLGPKAGMADAGIRPETVGTCLLAVLGISFGTIYQKRFAQHMEMRGGVFYQYAGAFIVTAVAALLTENGEVQWTGEFVFALSWLVFVLSLGAISLLMLLIRKGAVSGVAGLFYLVPAATAVEGYFLFDEALTPVQIVGMLIAIGAVALVSRASTRPRAETA
ncbi:drug/metabolite transporter (DMT)-like permease [Breoghania corrubedonensis]|uniref:Drug/metabolite transporter (DMT)-like permease n=1 Tax=Breoghania corrubedonensis TaxID=665038 RepID=A0A2T5V5V3_9HYPH|nr:DMT family transporter [Breoghania corrubedonensis]PTW59134.1 drug/metabolite transporter (DMT)-like permease [Breoghania corrubedonensis]